MQPLPRFNKIIIALIAIFSGFTSVFAATPVVHISPKPGWLTVCKPYDKKPSLRTVESGYYYEIVEHQIQVEQQADYHHYIRQIISEAGIQNGSEVSVSFDPTFETVNFHEITVWRDGKPLNRLKASAFKVLADEKDLSNFIYQGSYSALYILDDIRKGDRIEYSYTITGRNPIYHNKFCENIYLQWFQTVEHLYTSVIFSPQRKMNMKSFNQVVKPAISEANGLRRYEWEDFQVKAASYEDTEPAWFDSRAYVQLSDYDNWGEVTNWALSINPVKTSIKGELAAQIAKLKKEAGTDQQKYFRNAVKTVQDEVRYMGIEIGQYSHRANDPERVFSQRYGDCKDKSLLLVSMLRAGGIDANMVLVNTDMQDRIDQFIPSHNVFNHAVVVATLNGKQVWVDATIDYQRGSGTNIYFPAYGKGLVLRPGNTGLTAIPVTKTGKISEEEKFIVKNEKLPVILEVKTTYTLNEADRVRDRLASSGMAETEKSYLKYYAKIYNKIEAKDSVGVIDDEEKNLLITTEKYEIDDFFKKDSTTGVYRVDFYASPIREELPSITNQLKNPVDVNYPFNEDYTVKVILPVGWSINPRKNSISRDEYKFESNYSAIDSTLTLNYQFTYLKDYIPVDKLGQFKQDIKELSDNALSYVISYTPDDAESSSDVNQWMINLSLCIALVFGAIAVWIYRMETPGIVFSYGASFVPIGGELISLVIILSLVPLIMTDMLIERHYLSLSTWKIYYHNKDSGVLILEVVANVIMSCYSIFCLVLLLNKRDILPRYITGYFVAWIAFSLGRFILIGMVFKRSISPTFIENNLWPIIVSAFCIVYFQKSHRVLETFIVPHPADNYSYEGAEEGH